MFENGEIKQIHKFHYTSLFVPSFSCFSALLKNYTFNNISNLKTLNCGCYI